MFDGIRIYYRIEGYKIWLSHVSIEPIAEVDIGTGLIKSKQYDNQETIIYKAKFETYNLVIKEVIKNGEIIHWLIIDGSLHKNHFGCLCTENYRFFQVLEDCRYRRKR